MDLSQNAIIGLVFGAFVCAGVTVAASMLAGYWAGRNSTERPFRSESNPRQPKEPRREAQGEPEGGDIYQEAAFGEDKGPVPTMPGEGR